MQEDSSKNKRVVKNALFMYIRMFFTMCVGLYTSRVVLRILGVEDYGLNNVVGGIVAMFGFLNGAMTNATSRFITFELGKGNSGKLNLVFNTALVIHLIVALVIVLLGETIGLWFLHNKMQIAESRMFVAEWLYQFSVASTVVLVLTVPYNSLIIAYERMSVFAYISIIDVLLKLMIVFLLVWSPFDKLLFYGSLLFAVQMFDMLLYVVYCKKKFAEAKVRRCFSRDLFKGMFSFAGWGLLGNFAFIFFNQGINIFLNMFCGPAVNAARAIAVQVDNVVKQFSSNVQTAINPQIIKSFAEKDLSRMHALIMASSKFCFFLLLLLSMPIIVETHYILNLWLVNVPDHTVNFLRMTLCISLLDAFINPMFTANLASGKVKIYQILISIVSYTFMPITYFAIKFTSIPESVFICVLICNVIGIVVRLFIMKYQVKLLPQTYIKNVFIKVCLVTVVAAILPSLLYVYLNESFYRFILIGLSCVVCISTCVYVLGINDSERNLLKKIVGKKLKGVFHDKNAA